MELGEVVNPHYAFPIVCVVVCALLVFAFGFKSPGQPPSFDAVLEEERKSTKKRKGKDSQKSKLQQNGRPGGIPASNKADSGNHPSRGKQTSEKHVVKSEPKQNKKNRISQYKKAEVGIDAYVVAADDNNEGEWVQQLSKKERKNRKREEITVSLNTETEKPVIPETLDTQQNLTHEHSCDSQENSPKKKGKKNQKESESSKSSKNDILASKNDKISIQDVEMKSETMEKDQRPPKKKKQKDEAKIVSDVESIPVRICDNDETNITNSENGIIDIISRKNEKEETIENLKEFEQSLIESVPKDDPKVQLKKKKGKKKNQENNLDADDVVADIMDADEIKPVRNAVADNVPENTTVPETRCTKETDSSHSEIEHEKDPEIETQGDSNKNSQIGSNVVFDELGDMWQNAKPQRKKKKARREQ